MSSESDADEGDVGTLSSDEEDSAQLSQVYYCVAMYFTRLTVDDWAYCLHLCILELITTAVQLLGKFWDKLIILLSFIAILH